MRKAIILCVAAVGALALAAEAQNNYTAVSLPTNGVWKVPILGAGRVEHIQVEGASPADGTFTVSRISQDGSVTNALFTRTLSGGAVYDTLPASTNIWIMAGDKLQRSGTATSKNHAVLILRQ
jgi:hypothetical protein